MSYQFPADIETLVRQQMAAGNYRSEDDLLREALHALESQRQMVVYEDPEVIAGVQRGLDEMRRGFGRPFEEYDAELRARHNI